MQHKKYYSLVFIGLVLINSISFVAHAAPTTQATPPSCQACFNTSPYIDRYIDFGDEIIKTMLTYANKNGSVFTTPKNVGSSDGDEFTRKLASIVDNMNANAQTLVGGATVGLLVTTEGSFLDSRKSLLILMQSPVITRDWTKLDTMGQKVMNTMLDMGNAGILIKFGFKPGFQERINDIILAYSKGSNALFTVNGTTNFSYEPADLLSALWAMTQGLKTAIAGAGTSELDVAYLNDELAFSDNFRYELGGNPLTNTKSYYSCAQWLKGISSCSSLGKDAKDSAKAIWGDTKKQTQAATKIVTDSIKRLKAFWAQNGSVRNLTQRQDDYLRSQNGLKGVRTNEGDPIVAGFTDSWKGVKDGITSLYPFPGSSTHTVDANGCDSRWYKFKTCKQPIYIGDIQTELVIQNNANIIADAVNDTITTAQSNRQYSLFASVDPITKTFPLLTQEIMSAKYKIDSANTNAIIQNLGKACDTQCSNVGGRCWADK